MPTDDIEILLATIDAKRAEIEAALAFVDVEHAAGRTGYAAYMRAKAASDALTKLLVDKQQQLDDAFAAL